MTSNVTLPASGTGTTTPVVETIQQPDLSQRQVISVAGVTGAPSVTPTITSASAYASGNEVGGLMTFTNAVRNQQNTNSGTLQSVIVTCKTVQFSGLDLYLFSSNPSNSTWTDKTSPAINAADVSKLILKVPLALIDSGLGTHTLYQATGINFPFNLGSSNTSLYGVLVTRGTPTYGSTTDIVVTLGVWDD